MIRHSRQVFQYKYWNNYFLLYPKLYGDIKSKSPDNEQQIINNVKKTLESINSWTRSFPQAAVNKIRVGGVPLWESKISKKDFGKIKDHLLELQHGLITAGEKKRSIMKKLDEVREVLHNIYQGMEMNKINEAYLNSIRKEMDVLCEMEKHLNKMYTEVDHEEQLLLSESSLAINGAFEKIKKDRQFMKLVSIIGAVVSSLITIIWVSYEQSKNKKILQDTITQLVDEKQKNESWGSYFKRNTRWIYGWAIPSK